MRKMLVIALREYHASVRTKAFIVSLVLMPVLMGGSILVQVLVTGMGDTEEKRFAVVDRSGGQFFRSLKPIEVLSSQKIKNVPLPFEVERLKPAKDSADPSRRAGPRYLVRLRAAAPKGEATDQKPKTIATFLIESVAPGPNIDEQRYELSERVRRKELFGFAEIGPDVYKPPDPKFPSNPRAVVRYQSDTPTYDAFPNWVKAMVDFGVKIERCKDKKVSLQDLDYIQKAVPVASQGLSEKDDEGNITDKPQNPVAAIFAPLGLMMLMFMIIMVGATPLIQGIVEEKMQRIAEVLLGSVRPFDLMMGKLLGMVGVSLTLAAVYLTGAYWAVHHFGYTEYLPWSLLGWFLLFQTVAVLMFGSLFIAIGAACTDTRETQTMVMPVMLLVVLPLMVWHNVIREPNSSFSLWLSLFPFATPMLMIARQAVPPGIPLWQPLVGTAVVLATTVLCVYAAGRIFRVGILMQGKGAKFKDLIRWVFRG
jgi:ABC-2 type transport system permease protein